MQKRRDFLKTIAASTGVAATTANVLGCSSLDNYLFTDPPDLKDTVMIVGGGVSGLYAAYQLRKRKIPYKIFEASRRLGGQILSDRNSDKNFEYGAFEFSNSDETLRKLCKELNVETEKMDASTWTFKSGSSFFLNQLVQSVVGLLPDRILRLRHRLVEVGVDKKKLQFTFASEKSDRTYESVRALIAVPAQNLIQVKRLIPANKALQVSEQRVVRVVLSLPKALPKSFHKSTGASLNSSLSKSTVFNTEDVIYSIRVRGSLLYITLTDRGYENPSFPVTLEALEKFIAHKVFEDSKLKLNLKPENIYDWGVHPVLRISQANWDIDRTSFAQLNLAEEKVPDTQAQLVCISDGIVKPAHRVEYLLRTVDEQIDRLV